MPRKRKRYSGCTRVFRKYSGSKYKRSHISGHIIQSQGRNLSLIPVNLDAEGCLRDTCTPSKIHLSYSLDTPIYFPSLPANVESWPVEMFSHHDVRTVASNVCIHCIDHDTCTSETQHMSIDPEPTGIKTEPTSIDPEHTGIKTEPTSIKTEPMCIDLKPKSIDTEPISINVCNDMKPLRNLSNTDESVKDKSLLSDAITQPFDWNISLQKKLSTNTDPPFLLDPYHKNIHLLQLYRSSRNAAVKISVIIKEDFTAAANVHRNYGVVCRLFTIQCLQYIDFCDVYANTMCIGNPDRELQELVPLQVRLDDSDSTLMLVYCEDDFLCEPGRHYV